MSSVLENTQQQDGRAVALLRALLVADLVDSTALVERLGDARAAEVLRQHDRLARRLIREHAGQEIDKTDGFLVMFERPVQAAAFALAYQRALHELATETGQALRARVGIHVGEVMAWQNSAEDVARGAKPIEVEGLAKPVAARLMGLALPGQVLLSATAHGLAQRAHDELESVGFRPSWRHHGDYSLKGVPEPVTVYEVGEADVAPLRAPHAGGKAHRVVPLWRRPFMLVAEFAVALLVLGLFAWDYLRPTQAIAFAARDWVVMSQVRNLTGDERLDDALDAAFRMGIEQSRHVNLFSDLQVSSALMRMGADPNQPLQRDLAVQVALREGAKAVFAPSVTELGGRIRVSVDLIDPSSGRSVRNRARDVAELGDLLSAVDAVSQELRSELGESLATITTSSEPLEQVTTSNLEALKAYSKAIRAMGQRRAIEGQQLLLHAIELDPDFALAHAKLAAVYLAGDRYEDAREPLRRAVSNADRLTARERLYLAGLEAYLIDYPTLTQRWSVLGEMYPDFAAGAQNLAVARWQFGNDFAAALPAYLRAAAVNNPLRGFSLQGAALAHTGLGQLDEAASLYREALQDNGTSLFDSHVDPDLIAGKLDSVERTLSALGEDEPHQYQSWKLPRRLALSILRNRPEEAMRTLASFGERHESRLSPPERIRLQLLNLSIALRNDHTPDDSGEQLRAVLDSLEQLTLASKRLDYATEHYVLFAAVLAARHGLADSARAMLDLRRAKSAPTTPYSASLEEAARVELGELPPSPSAISNSLTIQLAYSHLRLLQRMGSDSEGTLAGALCRRKPQALAEWGSGFTLLVDNLAAVEEACHHSARSTVASE